MADTPIENAVKAVGTNVVLIEGTASEKQGAEIKGTLEREKNGKAGGVTGGIGQKTGWNIGGFFKWSWK